MPIQFLPMRQNSLLAVLAVCFLSFLNLLNAQPLPEASSPAVSPAVSSNALPGDARLLSGEDSRPWVYYWWLKGNVSEELITHDLEAMANKGIGGLLLVDSRGYHDDAFSTKHVPVPLPIKYEYMSPEWRKMVTHLVREANRLGLQVSMNIANTGGQLRGPWDLGEDGPKELIWTEENVNGPKTVEISLTVPTEKVTETETEPQEVLTSEGDRIVQPNRADAALLKNYTFHEDGSLHEGRYFQDVALIAVRITSPVSEGRESVKLNQTWNRTILPEEKAPTATEVVNLASFVEEVEGVPTLKWTVPEGNWKILRFGSHVIGDVGSVDILCEKAVTRYFGLMCKQIMADVGDLAGKGKTLTHFYNVSWEGSDPNWTPGFAERFVRENRYELWTRLPILRGLNLNSMEESHRFSEDFLKSVSRAFRENCYLTIGKLCHEHGMVWHSEDGGPWSRGKTAWMGNFRLFAEADMLSFWGQNDVIQGEFWPREPKGPVAQPEKWPLTRTNARYASMAGNIYGKPLIAMEAFTHMVHHWTQYPAHLKPAADENFVEGANFFIWHTFTASPKELGKPGFEYFAGTHINTNITWWEQADGIFSYLERCQKLLRQGQYIADVCVYVSDRNYIGWGHGESWNPDSKLIPGKGWKFDLLDTNILTNRLERRESDGRLILPHGMNYKILVIDPLKNEPIPVEALEKALALAESGAIVVLGENIPTRNPGLADHEDRDARLKEVCEKLWGRFNAETKCVSVGKGRIYRGASMDEVMTSEKIAADFESNAEAHFIHLQDASVNRYFVAGSGLISCTFRATGVPTIYDAVSNRTFAPMACCALGDGRTRVTLQLPINGSAFVTFPNQRCLCESKHFVEVFEGGEPEICEWVDATNDEGIFHVWKNCELGVQTQKGAKLLTKAEPAPALNLNEDWTLRFAPNLGAPEGDVHFETLQPWNEHENPGIRFFSGTCRYTKTFTLTEEQAKALVRVTLGEVDHLASVRINGQEVRTVWTAPWTVDLTGKVKAGENTLEIDVTNTWANRLIGDAGLPEEKQIGKTNIYRLPEKNAFKAFQGFFATDPLMPSGLIGPVEVQFGVEVKFPL